MGAVGRTADIISELVMVDDKSDVELHDSDASP